MAKRPNPEIVSYIEKHLSKGFDIKHIKKKLAEVGHPIEAIEDAAQFVLAKQPKKPVPKFVIVYGLILLVAISGFAYYAWFKATQQVEYKETVQEIQKNQVYAGRTDVELIKMAAAGDMGACGFIKSHNLKYACDGKYWERDDCLYSRYIGEADICFFNKALADLDTGACRSIKDEAKRAECKDVVFSDVIKSKDYAVCRGNTECLNSIFTSVFESLSFDFCDLYNTTSGRDHCIFNLSLAQNDDSHCKDISPSTTRWTCQGRMLETPEEFLQLCSEAHPEESSMSLEKQRLSCVIGIVSAALGKGFYTCDRLWSFIDSNKQVDFLRDFDSEFKTFANSLEPNEENKKVVACVR